MTILIPVLFSVVLALLVPPFKKENKTVAHVVVVLTLLIAVALIMPLKGSISRDDMVAVFRVGVMLAVSVFALVIYFKSYIDERRARNQRAFGTTDCELTVVL